MITNEAGQVALKYRAPGPAVALGKYQFIPRAGVSIAFVDPGDAGHLLRKRDNCCNRRRLFFEPTEAEVAAWQASG